MSIHDDAADIALWLSLSEIASRRGVTKQALSKRLARPLTPAASSRSLTKRVPARASEAGPSMPAHLHFDEGLQLVNVGRRPTVGGGENLDEPLRDQAHAIVTTCHSIWLPALQPRLDRAGTPANRSPRM
jgi:hypothetical protein